MDTRLIDLLVCPICKGPLHRPLQTDYLICRADRLAFPIHDGIPVMLETKPCPWMTRTCRSCRAPRRRPGRRASPS